MRTFPDNMLLWGLCTLACALCKEAAVPAALCSLPLSLLTSALLLVPGVSAVTVLTQGPPDVRGTRGQSVSMDCNLGYVEGSSARWYKQAPGGVPQFLLYFHHSYSSPTYGSGVSSSKFTCTHQSKRDYRLTINNVDQGDTAVYYCKTWDDSVKEWVHSDTDYDKNPCPSLPLLLLSLSLSLGVSSVSVLSSQLRPGVHRPPDVLLRSDMEQRDTDEGGGHVLSVHRK